MTYEGRYVSGYVAASVSKTAKIGYIASFPIPEVIRDINAVMLGMQKVNPKAELKIIWVNTWFDPGKERSAAEVMMDQGVDVIIQHTDSPAAMQAAEKRGKWAVGQASDMSHFGPNAHLLSVVNDWSNHYIATVQKVMDGNWKPQDYWGGMADNVIRIQGTTRKSRRLWLPKRRRSSPASRLERFIRSQVRSRIRPVRSAYLRARP